MLHVAAPGGDDDRLAVELEAEREEDAAHLCLGHVRTEQTVDLFRFELHGLRHDGFGQHVDGAAHHLTAAEQLHELACAIHGGDGIHRVEPLLKAAGGLRAHTERGSRAAHARAVEVRALKDDHGRVAHDLGVGAAHDAGDRDGLLLVADAEHIRREPARRAVERLDGLALARGAHDDLLAADAREIEGVHGLAVLEHDIVCDVDDIVDRAHAAVAQALAHPRRGRADLDVAHHARGVARAERGIVDADADMVADVLAAAGHVGRVQLQGLVKGHGGLTRQTDHRQAVRAVGRDLKLDHMVVRADDGGDVVAGLHAVLLHDPQAVLDGVGVVMQRQTELLERAHHAVGCLAAQRAGVDLLAVGQQRAVERDGHHVSDLLVLCTGHDLDRFITAHVDLTDPHVVGVRVAHHLHDAPRDDVSDAVVQVRERLHLRAGEGHCLGKVVVGPGRAIYEFIEPFSA